LPSSIENEDEYVVDVEKDLWIRGAMSTGGTLELDDCGPGVDANYNQVFKTALHPKGVTNVSTYPTSESDYNSFGGTVPSDFFGDGFNEKTLQVMIDALKADGEKYGTTVKDDLKVKWGFRFGDIPTGSLTAVIALLQKKYDWEMDCGRAHSAEVIRRELERQIADYNSDAAARWNIPTHLSLNPFGLIPNNDSTL